MRELVTHPLRELVVAGNSSVRRRSATGRQRRVFSKVHNHDYKVL
jgi:hypothetical protein